MVSTTSFIKKTTDEILDNMKNMFNLSDSKIFDKFENKEMRAHMHSLKHTLEKCSNGRLIPNELKPVVSMFENSNYDITKLPKKYADNINDTYARLKFAINNDPKFFKNKTANLYCDIYDTITFKGFRKLVDRLKTSSAFDGSPLSKEELMVMDNLDNYIADSKIGYGRGAEAGGIFGLAKLASSTAALSFEIKDLTLIISVVLILLIVLFVSLLLILIQYNKCVANAITELGNSGGGKIEMVAAYKQAAVDLESEIAPATNMTLFKCARIGGKYISELSNNSYSTFDKMMTVAEKKKNSKENMEQSNEALSTIVIPAMIVGVTCFILIPLIRSSIYYIHHLKLKINTFLVEQSEVLSVNIEDLETKINDISTPEMEKTRLKKVMERQMTWYKNLIKMSEIAYKCQIEAGREVTDNINEDDKINFDRIVDAEDNGVNINDSSNIDVPQQSNHIIF